MLRWLSLLFVATGLLTACSNVKLVYKRLDWVVPAYVAGYVDLDATQRVRLDSHLSELLDWHCASQLRGYAHWLRTVGTDFQARHVSYARLEDHYTELHSYWREVANQVTPRLTELLHGLNDEQLSTLFSSMRDDNDEFREDYVDRPLPEVQRKYARRIEKRLRRWLGKLTPEQKVAIAEWSRQIEEVQTERLRMRLRWQSALRQALDERTDTARLEARIRDLFVHPEHLWSDAYREQVTAHHHSVLQLLEDVSATMTIAQRDHLRDRTARWAADLDELACSAKSYALPHSSNLQPAS